jgi:hypothetical protein
MQVLRDVPTFAKCKYDGILERPKFRSRDIMKLGLSRGHEIQQECLSYVSYKSNGSGLDRSTRRAQLLSVV